MLTNGTGKMCRNVKGGAIEQVRKGENPIFIAQTAHYVT